MVQSANMKKTEGKIENTQQQKAKRQYYGVFATDKAKRDARYDFSGKLRDDCLTAEGKVLVPAGTAFFIYKNGRKVAPNQPDYVLSFAEPLSA